MSLQEGGGSGLLDANSDGKVEAGDLLAMAKKIL